MARIPGPHIQWTVPDPRRQRLSEIPLSKSTLSIVWTNGYLDTLRFLIDQVHSNCYNISTDHRLSSLLVSAYPITRFSRLTTPSAIATRIGSLPSVTRRTTILWLACKLSTPFTLLNPPQGEAPNQWRDSMVRLPGAQPHSLDVNGDPPRQPSARTTLTPAITTWHPQDTCFRHKPIRAIPLIRALEPRRSTPALCSKQQA
jgi:hypothetical protein